MAKPIGSPKSGGRSKGTPNKKTQLLSEILEAKSFCIPEKLIELLPSLSAEKQADVLLDLMAYQFPKRKAVEQTTVSTNLHAHVVNVEGLDQEQLDNLHRATAQKLYGYDLSDDEQRYKRLEYLSKCLDITSRSPKITLKKRPSQG